MTHRRNLLLLPLFLLLAVGPAAAQEPTRNDRVDVEEELLPELARFAVSFWVPRLNGYKVRIDRSLPASELATLEALRIRWGIVIEEETNRLEQRTQSRMEGTRRREAEPAERDDVADAEADFDIDECGLARAHLAEEGSSVGVAPASENSTSATIVVKGGVRDDGEPRTIDQSSYKNREPQPEDLFESTQAIALRNRVRMDAIHDLVVVDINTFLDAGIELIDRFYEKNIGRIEGDDHDGMLQEWPEMRESLQSPDARAKLLAEFDEFYSQGVEAFVMLYNGEDLFRLLGMALPASAPLPNMKIPESSMLAQNAPNPAGSSTRIGYTLVEPSSSTSIEIFAASGGRVLTLDQGARPAGEHAAVVDLSKLSSGSYLYRLTVQTANGEQVSSRVMQVVR